MNEDLESVLYLKTHLTPQRFHHSIQVAQVMEKATEVYGLSKKRCVRAGLWHDIAREWSDKKVLAYLAEREPELIETTPEPLRNNLTLHGAVGAYEVQRLWGCHDPQLLRAIREHAGTFLRVPRFSVILHVADQCAPASPFLGQQKLEKLFLTGQLDLAELLLRAFYLEYFRETGIPIHPNHLVRYEELLHQHQSQLPPDFFART